MQGSDPRILPVLPNEVFVIILAHLQRCCTLEDLKRLRLTSKALAGIVTSQLFHRVVLLPYADELEDFAAFMASNQQIASHVKHFVYDCEWRCRTNLCVVNNESLDGRILLERMCEHGFVDTETSAVEMCMLVHCFQALPNLCHLSVSERNLGRAYVSPTSNTSPLPRYIRNLLRGSEQLPGHFRFAVSNRSHGPDVVAVSKLLLMASSLARVKLQELRLLDQEISHFIEQVYDGPVKDLRMMRNVVQSVKRLELSFARESRSAWDVKDQRAVADMILAAQDLEQLSWAVPEQASTVAVCWTSKLSAIMRAADRNLKDYTLFPRLVELRLGPMICQEAELTELLRLHCGTLRTITLQSLSLTNSRRNAPSACWVRVLNVIRDLRIYVELVGQFTNHDRQFWIIAAGQDDTEDCLKSDVYKWLRGTCATCPDEIQAAAVDTVANAAVMPRGQLCGGDWTWQIKSRGPDRSEQEMMAGQPDWHTPWHPSIRFMDEPDDVDVVFHLDHETPLHEARTPSEDDEIYDVQNGTESEH